jgi:formylmethanofuran dehydrogenase subunit E
MANRYPYTCQDCGIKMMRSYAKAFGATMLCSQCYAAKIRELVGNFHG